MNNKRTSIDNNDWITPKANKSLTQYSPNTASAYNVRPPNQPSEKFNNEHFTKSNKPISSMFNSRVYESSANQASCPPVSFTPNAIYSPRLTHQALSLQQTADNFPFPQNMHGIRHEAHTIQTTSGPFSKIPCNLASVQSLFPAVNDNVPPHLSTNQYSSNRNPSCDQTKMISAPNSGIDHFMRQNPAMSSTSEFARLPHPSSSNPSDFIRQPPSAFNMSNFERQPFLHDTVAPGSNNNDSIRQQHVTGSYNPNFIRQPPPSSSSNPNFVRPPPSGSSNPNFIRPPPLGSNNPNFVRPPPSGFNNTNFMRQPPPSNSDNLNFVRPPPFSSNMPDCLRPPPPISFSNLDCVRQPPPNFMAQQPPILPSNSSAPSSNLSNSMQIPPPPNGSTLNQNSQSRMFYGPNLSVLPPPVNQDWIEENKINKFMEKFTLSKRSAIKHDITVIEFRNRLKEASATVRKLMELKENLLSLVNANENEWNEKLKEILQYKGKLNKDCDFLSEPETLQSIQERLKCRKRKRELKKKIKLDRIKEKSKKVVDREELHCTIDKWLESLKEKNLKLKREAELKKEADSILAEVRRKIHEAKRTIEKIKVFEKLRSARHANAIKKGLFLPNHDEKFQNKISELKSTLFKQLSDYESEERALKVMLEAEQEGQLEEEAQWRIKKLKNLQQRRQRNITEALFGNEEEPTEENSLFLFHQFHISGSKSIENLVQIRHHWDLHLSEDGEAIPLQWVVPVPPSSTAWEVALEK